MEKQWCDFDTALADRTVNFIKQSVGAKDMLKNVADQLLKIIARKVRPLLWNRSINILQTSPEEQRPASLSNPPKPPKPLLPLAAEAVDISNILFLILVIFNLIQYMQQLNRLWSHSDILVLSVERACSPVDYPWAETVPQNHPSRTYCSSVGEKRSAKKCAQCFGSHQPL